MGINENRTYVRYHIDTKPAPDIENWPPRFDVEVGKIGLARELVSEFIKYGFKHKDVVLSRPCLYGVFSGPIGGFAPRTHLCVGCLRCTTEYPEFVKVSNNPERRELGDSYFTFNFVNAINYEAETGMIPVKGAGYRGEFGGQGWEGMWTDMSEIVRPTRDGIHGREFISTVVDIGYKPNFLVFDPEGQSVGSKPHTISIPLPLIFDDMPTTVVGEKVWRITSQTAEAIGSLAIIPVTQILEHKLESDHIVPLIKSGEHNLLESISSTPPLVEIDGWDEQLYNHIRIRVPDCLVSLRLPFSSSDKLLSFVQRGIQIFHLVADYHGHGEGNQFVLDMIRTSHRTLVAAGIRQEVTLIGSGGMIAAEHIPKAILCGLDVVALDTPLVVALQGKFEGEGYDRETSQFTLPVNLTVEWGQQRLMNLVASWRDQLLEISGAMGIREIRRMRGEMGRAMFMVDLESEAFAGVDGYEV